MKGIGPGAVVGTIIGVIFVLTFFVMEAGIRSSFTQGEEFRQASNQVSEIHSKATRVCTSEPQQRAPTRLELEDYEVRFEDPEGTNISIYSGGEFVTSEVVDSCDRIDSDSISASGTYQVVEFEEKSLKVNYGVNNDVEGS